MHSSAPSCSAYALRAVEVHGAVKGSWLAARRVARCHPWARGGYDPVPGTPELDEEMRVRAGAADRLDDSPGPAGPIVNPQNPDNAAERAHTAHGRGVN